MKYIYTITLLLMFISIGCVDIDQDEDYDKSELLKILDEDDAAGIDGFDDGGLLDLDYDMGLELIGSGRTLGDTLAYGEGYRIRFGRQITDRERTVDFTIDGDTAIGVVNYMINGVFMAQAKDTSTMEVIDSIGFSKEFSSTMTRKVKYARVDNSNNPDGYSWRIIALTPLTGGAGDKVSITSVEVYDLNLSVTGEQLAEEGELIYSISSDGIEDLYMDRETLPTFTSFNSVIVKVTVENTGPEYSIDTLGVGEWAMVRYGRSAAQRGRRRLNDYGAGIDSDANDNIHTGVWRVHGPGIGQNSRVFRSFFSTIDLATLFTEDGGYNSVTWSLPYRSQRPD
jgi:hypothetical protein